MPLCGSSPITVVKIMIIAIALIITIIAKIITITAKIITITTQITITNAKMTITYTTQRTTIMTRSRKKNRPNNDLWVAKEDITLWDFQRGKDPIKIQFSK